MVYSDISWFRDHGYLIGDYPDVLITEAIREASLFIDNFTGMWFESRELTLLLDGNSQGTLFFYIPILGITEITYSNTVQTLSSYVIYNRWWPDDRHNPQVRVKSGSFPKGQQNVGFTGIFGYVDLDPDVMAASVSLDDRTDPVVPTLRVIALSVGTRGNSLTVNIEDGTANPGTEFNLSVYLSGVLKETFEDLSMDDSADNFVETAINTISEYITVMDLDSASVAPDDRPAVSVDNTLSGGVETYMTPPEIVKVCRLLAMRSLGAPLEDSFAQAELDHIAKIASERTDKHAISYRSRPPGTSGLTGNTVIDEILVRFKGLRPKYAGFV